jgi:hypothetical protein
MVAQQAGTPEQDPLEVGLQLLDATGLTAPGDIGGLGEGPTR